MDSSRIHTCTQCTRVIVIPRSSPNSSQIHSPSLIPHPLPTSCPLLFFNSPPDSVCAVHVLTRAGPGAGEQAVY